MLSTFFALLGLVWILSILLGLVKFIRLYFLAPSKLHRYVYRSTVSDGVLQTPKEPWAVVTGASDGIGRFLAAELAAAGLNVVLHGRSAAKLEKVQASLQSTYPARSFRLLVADASLVRGAAHFADDFNNKEDDDGTQVDFANMYNNVLRDLHITVLINNVGGGIKNPLMGDFLAYTARQNAEAASKESLFALHLTHALLPQLRRNGPGGALVVGVGSMADAGMPLAAVYSASKAFNKTLLACLALEERLDRRGGGRNGNNHRKKDGGGSSSSRGEVEIMHVRLGDVTDVTWRRGASSLLMPDARTAARAILARVGCGCSVVTAYWGHELLGVGLELLPIWLRERFLLSMMSGYRESMEHKGGDASASIIGSGFF